MGIMRAIVKLFEERISGVDIALFFNISIDLAILHVAGTIFCNDSAKAETKDNTICRFLRLRAKCGIIYK